MEGGAFACDTDEIKDGGGTSPADVKLLHDSKERNFPIFRPVLSDCGKVSPAT